ncbi:hypothetical protein [Porphyromonas sp.]|uniref:HU domain-containing protein n=1 Tax=Porphyromonas sp. TaxID=1924944 RepID=UPI0026DD2BF2|nr:hypothetical protein [Porphyromonas sp.]MDO4771635.1 hypothetical protein [Porphyromonas sp.]
MRRLIRHIEQSLYIHECVVVPGFGAFIKHRVSSSLDEGKGLIYPGHFALSFNTAVQQNDGILVKSYSVAFAMSYKRALALLEKDIEELRTALHSSSVVALGSIGRMSMDKGGERISFYPNAEHPFSISHYGLNPVAQLPTLHRAQPASTPSLHDGVYYLPINIKGLKYGVAVLALMAMTWFIPTKTISVPQESYRAGFFTSIMDRASEQAKQVPTAEASAEIQTPPAVGVTETSRLGGLPLVTEVRGEHKFFVIVATYKTESGVEKHMQYNDLSKFPNAGILRTDNSNYKIYVEAFGTKEEAVAYVGSTLKEINGSISAWIHKVK